MSNTNDISKTLQLMPKYMQALLVDASLYFSDEVTIATPERKVMLIKNIKMIQEQLSFLENNLYSNENQ
jgi:hypothetical protein